MSVPGLPTLRSETRYIVFLVSGKWEVAPVVDCFAVMPAGSVEFLASSHGLAIRSLDEVDGFAYSDKRLFTIPRAVRLGFDPPIRSELLELFGESLASQITTKKVALDTIGVAVKKYNIVFEDFHPMPELEMAWNQSPVGDSK
jgi:hypothetical protein